MPPVCKYFCIVLCTITYLSVQAQDPLGIRMDNFSGINSIGLNPAGYMTTPYNWDVNLFSVDFFMQNNYAYFSNESLLSLGLSGDESFVYGPDNRNRDVPEQGIIFDYYDDDKDRYGLANHTFMWPSFFIRINGNNALGLFAQSRASGSIIGIPNEVSFYKFNDLLNMPNFVMEEAKASITTWTEFGLNYLHQTPVGDGELGLGVNVKYLIGHEAAYVYNEIPIQIARLDGDSLSSSSGTIEFGYTSTTLAPGDYTIPTNGRGLGVDLGVNYAMGDGYNGSYKWRLGASLLDIGTIKFNENTSLQRASVDTTVIFGGSAYKELGYKETETTLKFFSHQLFGDSTATQIDNQFTQWLPSTLSLQVDYNIAPNLFVSGVLIQGIPFNKNAVYRSNFLSVTPRYESRWFSAALPVSFNHFREFNIGLSVRLGPIYMGTNDMGSMIVKSDLDGTSFYMGIKINPFSANGMFEGGLFNSAGGGRSGGKSRIGCYKF